ncbi:MAG: hypothetical protein Q9M13_02645, partial [Mariprofundales bacterium]|nr:hypothetical protein [Mariprofundales bacterium]
MSLRELVESLQSASFSEAALAVLNIARRVADMKFQELGLDLIERAVTGSERIVEVKGLRERVYASYACGATPYIAFSAAEGDVRVDVVVSYSVSP